jgi:hypothetical protein
MNTIRIGTPTKAPEIPHMTLQKKTAKMMAKGDTASEAPVSRGSDSCR